MAATPAAPRPATQKTMSVGVVCDRKSRVSMKSVVCAIVGVESVCVVCDRRSLGLWCAIKGVSVQHSETPSSSRAAPGQSPATNSEDGVCGCGTRSQESSLAGVCVVCDRRSRVCVCRSRCVHMSLCVVCESVYRRVCV